MKQRPKCELDDALRDVSAQWRKYTQEQMDEPIARGHYEDMIAIKRVVEIMRGRSQQRVDLPTARWEEDARALLKLAIELAEELRNRCDDPIHDEQIASLRALETQWAGSGQID